MELKVGGVPFSNFSNLVMSYPRCVGKAKKFTKRLMDV